MSSYRDERFTRSKSVQRSLYLLGRLQSADKFDVDTEFLKTVYRGIVMLSCKNCRGTEYYRLLIVTYRLEYCPQRNLRFSVTYVAAEKPVHNDTSLHIRLYLLHRRNLVGRRSIGKSVLEILLQIVVFLIFIAVLCLSLRIQIEQVNRHSLNRSLDALFDFFKVLSAYQRKSGLAVASAVSRKSVQFVYRHVKIFAVAVFDDNILCVYVTHLYKLSTQASAYTVYFVYDVIPDFGHCECLCLLRFDFFTDTRYVLSAQYGKLSFCIYKSLGYLVGNKENSVFLIL